jgi:hypothetical protein
MYGYYAAFGTGGTFQMTGPDDLTLLGEITGGYLTTNDEASYTVLNFAGQWSNSRPATGYFEVYKGEFREADLDLATGLVPEPASLALLGQRRRGSMRRSPTTGLAG